MEKIKLQNQMDNKENKKQGMTIIEVVLSFTIALILLL